MSSEEEPEIKFKLVILGVSSVGKTSILLRYVNDSFSLETTPTIGSAFLSRIEDVNGTKVSLNIWDTAGQERYAEVLPLVYRDAQAIITVFDVVTPKSFERACEWVRSIKEDDGSSSLLVLCCNKIDIAPEFDTSDAYRYALENGLKLFSTSAKTGNGIRELFSYVAEKLIEEKSRADVITPFRTTTTSVVLEPTSKPKTNCC